MNWAPLTLATIFGALGVAMFVRHKAPRAAAVIIALAVLFLLAGVPSLLARLGHPIPPGPLLLGIVAVAVVSAFFFYLDVIRGEHKKPLFARKGAAAAGVPGGGSNHHIRPLAASIGLLVAGLLVAFNWAAIWAGGSHGFSQTVDTITHQQAS